MSNDLTSLAAIERAARELIAALAEMNAAIDERPMNRERFDAAWDRDGQARAVYREATKDPAAVLALVERVREGERERLFFDGWYVSKEDAKGVLDHCIREGATAIGMVENTTGRSWGYLYMSETVLFRNHRIEEWIHWWKHGTLPSPRFRATTEHPRADAAAGEEATHE